MNPGPVAKIIENKLNQAFQPEKLEVINESVHHHGHAAAGEETHFRIKITARAFAGQSRVAQHRMVNEVLREELRHPVHALALETAAPAE